MRTNRRASFEAIADQIEAQAAQSGLSRLIEAEMAANEAVVADLHWQIRSLQGEVDALKLELAQIRGLETLVVSRSGKGSNA